MCIYIGAGTVAGECVYLYWGRNCSGGNVCICIGAGTEAGECVYLY